MSGLEKRGLVQRRANPRDNRETLISLTKSGERAYARMIAAAQASNDALLAPFSTGDCAQLVALVDRLTDRARDILAREQEGALGGAD